MSPLFELIKSKLPYLENNLIEEITMKDCFLTENKVIQVCLELFLNLKK